MKDLPKTYNPEEVEGEIYQKWEASGFFNPDRLEEAHDRYWKAEPFAMVMPPPNATGELHVGHALMLAIEDLMTRYARMSGKKALWLPGTDHAAIATQNVVERKIWETEKKTRHDLGREELLRRIENFVQETRGRIQKQIRAMGSSCDWSREKYTLSPELSLAVRTVFKQMYEKELIYRGERIVNWCPRCATTLADDEVNHKEIKGNLYYIRYPMTKGKDSLSVATTRPETMLGDTAVAVHPADSRYKKYVGGSVMLPLLNRELPVIADSAVDREFGTGVLKVTPGHDPRDFEIKERHNLEIINLFTPEGKISEQEAFDNGFEDYANLTAEEARKKIVQDLTDNGFLEKTEDILHTVGVCYRCETVVEPIVSKQWFVNVTKKVELKNPDFQKQLKLKDMASLKEIALAAVKSESIRLVPARFGKVYLQWMENLRDWNISRQIWFGHRIPVWYCGLADETRLGEMGFYDSVVPQVFAGKTKTYRLRDHQLKIGDRLNFKNTQTGEMFGIGTITNVEQTTVDKIDLQDPDHVATYEKQEQLIERLQFHNPGYKVQANTPVFIYTYHFAPTTLDNGCGEIIVSVEEPKQCPHCGNASLTQDPDTLDTWFSSSLWTFSTLGWPRETLDLATYHPTTILETGYDILFFWVARMVIMTGFALEDIPFHTVYLHGLVRDVEGKKMSKSKGNVLSPLAMAEKYGTDAFRLSLILGATAGNDMKIAEEKIQSYRNFVNKLWNISRFILTQIKNPRAQDEPGEIKTLADHWILAELQIVTTSVQKNLDNYQYGLAGEALADFTWNKLADWYLEISKIEKNKDGILQYLLTNLLKLWHPFIPFVTEYIWFKFFDGLLMIQEYPTPDPKFKTESINLKQFQSLQNLVAGLRNLRSEYRQPPAEIFASYLDLPTEQAWIKEQTPVIEKLARVKLNFALIPTDKHMPYFLWENARVYLIIPKFDPDKELALAEKELKDLKKVLQKFQEQLEKKDFLKKAPAAIVQKNQTDFGAAREREAKLLAKIQQLK